MSKLENIFDTEKWNENMTDEDLFYIQQVYFSERQGIPAIVDLIRRYSTSPKIALETLLSAIDTPSICSLEFFPYRECLRLLFSETECIESLCNSRTSLFINLLYRIVAELPQVGATRTLDRLEKIYAFSCVQKILEDKKYWGLERERVGVSDPRDSIFYNLLLTSDIDITKPDILNSHILRLILTKPDSTDNPGLTGTTSFLHNVARMALARNYTQNDYKYPCFLDHLFSITSPLIKSMNGRSTPAPPDLYVLDPASLSLFHDNLTRILTKMFRNLTLRGHFMDLIRNVVSQDRSKLVFDTAKNCSDVYAFNLYSILLSLSLGAFKKEYVNKIGQNVFPTFAFFHVSRLMEISILKEANAVMTNTSKSPDIIKRDSLRIKKYLDFVYDVIKENENLIYSKLIDPTDSKLTVKQLKSRIELVDVSIEEKRADSLLELLQDNAFINTILSIQLFLLPHHTFSPSMTDFVSMLFIYSNQHVTLAIQILQLSNCRDLIALKRLIRHYSENRRDDRIMDRMLINKMLLDKDLPADQNTLRAVNTTVADMEEWLSRALSAILKIKEHRRRGKMLGDLMQEDDPEVELSDEEVTVEPPAEGLRVLAGMSDEELEEYIRSEVIAGERYNRGGQHGRMQHSRGGHARGDNTTEAEVKRLMESMKGSLLYFRNQRAYKIHCKMMINESMMKQQEKILKEELFITENILVTMIHLTSRNRRLFLNKNIFQRLCLIVGKLLYDLLGKDSGSFYIENKEEYRFNPKELLRSLLIILINLLGGATVLVQKSGLDPELLEAGAMIAQKKYLLGESNIQVLFGIIDTLRLVQEGAQEETGDVPEHFIDPLTFEVMENPVRLLTSRVTIDRSTFNQIMLNDRIDPFNRSPLDESMCVVDEELAKEIKEYKKRAD